MDKFEVTARVKCMGRHHTIALTKSGKLSLLDHQGENEDALSALLVFNPNERCRCREVKLLWNWYRQTSEYRGPDWYQIREDHDWVDQAFSAKHGYFQEPTPSQILGLLPVPLRPYAQEAAQRHSDRRFKKWKVDPGVPERFLRMPKHNISGRLHFLRRRKIARILGVDTGVDTLIVPTDKIFQFENDPWFKAMTKVRLFPAQVPPMELWRTHYPKFVRAFRKANSSVLSDWQGSTRRVRYEEIWVRIAFLPATADSPAQYTFIKQGQLR